MAAKPSERPLDPRQAARITPRDLQAAQRLWALYAPPALKGLLDAREVKSQEKHA